MVHSPNYDQSEFSSVFATEREETFPHTATDIA